MTTEEINRLLVMLIRFNRSLRGLAPVGAFRVGIKHARMSDYVLFVNTA